MCAGRDAAAEAVSESPAHGEVPQPDPTGARPTARGNVRYHRAVVET